MNLQTLYSKLLSLPYRFKLILVFSLLIVLTALILGGITYYHFATASQREAKDYQVQLVEQIQHNFDRYLKEMQIISLSPLYDQNILNILKEHETPIATASFPPANERIEMWRYISSLIHSRNEIKGIHIMANDGTIFTNLDSNTVWLKMINISNSWLSQIRKADGEWVLLPLHTPDYYLNKDTEVFSVARLIREPSTNRHLGIIKLDLKQELFEEFISTENNIYILDERNKLIYPKKDQAQLLRFAIPQLENKQDYQYLKTDMDGQSYMMVQNQSDYSGAKVIMLTPFDTILSEVNQLRVLLLLVVLCGIFVSFILGFILSKPLVRSIYRLQNAMAEVQKGNLSKRVVNHQHDEIGQLSQGFNYMVDDIERLVTEVYETGLREMDAEIRALQSQMNPHFLYNTLESINMLAITKGNLDVSDMVTSLGKLLRYTIDHSAKIVSLQDELMFIRSYVVIQQMRMGDNLQYQEDIEPDLLHVQLPKVTLQPLIENAIIHGLSGQAGKIYLRVKEVGQEIHVIVFDNGKGMSKERLAKLKQSLYVRNITGTENHHGIALVNINERIKFLYGESYGMELNSEEGEGFTVILRFPINRQGEESC
ncbi:sensor histidine kinase [Lederbergia lenta]|uniref:histidine kinase n=1 Tax=Lederbergia lenta TaxID=1467 RepID=A0A2X4VYG2_LEDLE|nr:sensor histidine kinase [Lederbergia lenta]MEC2323478.1 sensor histidine kinase [Lederbergia lenta]SQI52918.1 two-component sensor histidine kinase [Lederbergia lenta]